MSLSEIRKAFQTLREVFEVVDTKFGNSSDKTVDSYQLLKADFYRLFMFLLGNSTTISPDESLVINSVLETNISTMDLLLLLREQNAYQVDFINSVPKIFSYSIDIDKRVFVAAVMSGNKTQALTPTIFGLYTSLGEAFVACEGEASNKKQKLERHLKKISMTIDKEIGSIIQATSESEKKQIDENKEGKNKKESVKKQYGPQIYLVGADIPAGEYKLISQGDKGYFGISTDANGSDIIRNENFEGQMYINVCGGQFLELTRCTAVSASEALPYRPVNGVYPPGEYKVGIEIPEGTYHLETNGEVRGYYSLEIPLINGARNIITNNVFSTAAYVSVTNGQILQLQRCRIKK